MEQRVSVITLGVRDLGRACAFYEEGLSWRRGNTDEGIVFFQVNGSVLALFPRDELAIDAGFPKGGGTDKRPQADPFGGITLAYCARSREAVDEVVEQARQAGARILKPPQETFWGGYSGYFADLDGHPWEVAWNPFWTLTAGGDVRLGVE